MERHKGHCRQNDAFCGKENRSFCFKVCSKKVRFTFINICAFGLQFLLDERSLKLVFVFVLIFFVRANGFEIVGIDILIDEDMKCWLLECNHAPNLEPHTELETKIKRGMIRDTLSLVDICNKELPKIIKETNAKMKIVEKLYQTNAKMKIVPLHVFIHIQIEE